MKILTTKKQLVFLIVSFIILVLDLTFVMINYFSSKAALTTALRKNATEQQQAFDITTSMNYNNMLQMTTFIAQNHILNQLFLRGKKAVEVEGGGAGGEQANQARQELLKVIKPGWEQMMKQFSVRQLHYHLGPGSLSFLRVHKPSKFGDRMDDVRYTIVDTNEKKTGRTGFETGRVYSGLRGVAPVWTMDPDTNEKVYVGALETGTSFSNVLNMLDKKLNIGFAVLLTQEHVERNMWQEFVQQHFKKRQWDNYYIEASSRANLMSILPNITFKKTFQIKQPQLIQIGEDYFSIYYFPLRDYRTTNNPTLPPVGLVMFWDNVTNVIHDFHAGIKINILYAIIGFILVEIAILFSIKIVTSQLQKIIDERTRELHLANQQKSKLFSIIAHDLRSPFTPILWYANYMVERIATLKTEKISEIANIIHQHSQELFHLIDTLLNWSRLQLDRIEIVPELFNLSERVEKTIQVLLPLASNKQITINYETPPIHVDADQNIVDIVIRNLINNAIKFTPVGGSVTLDVQEANQTIVVSISDTGVGISPERLTKIFSWDQLESTRGTADEKGTGLGLSVCYELITKQGGQLYVESVEGQGSTFYFTLKKSQ